jgi:putative transcriptional regulator
MTVNEFAQQLGVHMDIPGFLYLGGPINVKSLSFLHSNDWQSNNTLQINGQFSISSAEEILPRLALGDRPRKWRLFLGLSGWGPNQLQNEISGVPPYDHANSWCVAHSDPELVFEHDRKDQWIQALDKSGLEFARRILT